MSKPIEAFAGRLSQFSKGQCTAVPSVAETHEFTDSLINTLFPIKENGPSDPEMLAMELERCSIKLRELLTSISISLTADSEKPWPPGFSRSFLGYLNSWFPMRSPLPASIRPPAVSRRLCSVIRASTVLSVYRLANILYKLGVPVIPRVMTEYVHSKTGIDITSRCGNWLTLLYRSRNRHCDRGDCPDRCSM